MPMSAVELCAAALVKIGARPFAAFEEDTAEAACARRLYPIARDLLLGMHPWSFTLTQARLTPEPTVPVADHGFAFALPADHLRTVSVGSANRSRGTAYRIEGRHVLCDAPEIVLHYQRRVPEEELPAFFIPLLVTRLAAEFCIPLTEGSSRAMDLYRLAESELRSARLIDSQQTPPRAFDDFTLIAARLA
jgi:hypothetical protein